ncbi:MAG: hypothetical protein FWH41_01995 [Treponema sp.]|nr:hypothetical protein [Treponema sp.]
MEQPSLQACTYTDNADYSSHYAVEYFDTAGLFAITITPRKTNMPEPEKTITVTVKSGENGIANLQGEWMQGDNVSYSWKSAEMTVGTVIEWGASFDINTASITVDEWKLTDGDHTKTEGYYIINRDGQKRPLPENRIIRNVSRPDATEIQEGIGANGFQEYEIIIDVYDGQLVDHSKSFKIWNIQGMTVSHDSPEVVELTQANITQELKADSRTYVLTEDIELINWEPVGTAVLNNSDPPELIDPNNFDGAFQGRLYGNGYTITITSLSPKDNFAGIFGVAVNAEIRDLFIKYNNGSPIYAPASGNFFAGALGGYLRDTVVSSTIVIENSEDSPLKIIVPQGTANVWVGGIAGYLGGWNPPILNPGQYPIRFVPLVQNCYVGLAVECTDSGTGFLNIGGIAGEAGYADYSLSNVQSASISRASVSAVISVTKNNDGDVCIGGAVGKSVCIGIQNLSFLQINFHKTSITTITVNRGAYSGNTYCGGLVAYADFTGIFNSSFDSSIEVPSNFEGTGNVYIGGIISFIRGEGLIPRPLGRDKNFSPLSMLGIKPETNTSGERRYPVPSGRGSSLT